MTKFRYPTSLILSSLLYGGIVFSFINLVHSQPKVQKQQVSVIKVSVITPKPISKPKKVEKIQTPQPIIKKIVPKPKPKKKIKKKKPKPKKIIKKIKPKPKAKIIKKKPVIKEEPIIEEFVREIPVIEQPIIEEIYYPPVVASTPKQVRQEPMPIIDNVTPMVSAPQENLSQVKEAFLRGVRGDIYAHKRYPSVAKRRHIQGTVHVTFTILDNGEISDIQTSGASRLLQKAARKSLLKSSPVSIPSKLSGQFPMRNVSINIDFKLQ